MRKDNPTNKDVFPLCSTSWYRTQYKFEEKVRFNYIVATEGIQKEEWYQPFNVEIPEKQPCHPNEWNTIPYIHLARLNVEKPEDILDFVNRWGLLGLWKVKEYCEWPRPWLADLESKPLHIDKNFKIAFSGHYINNKFKGKSYYLRFQEPVAAFARAAKEYQYMYDLLKGDVDQKSEAEGFFNKYLSDCFPVTWYIDKWTTHWQTPSLLHTCYLLLWTDVLALRKYRRCQNQRCNKIFLLSRRGEDYCSFRCKENAKRNNRYHNVEKRKGD